MTTALVSLPQIEIKWSRPDQPLLVGKDVLELLSTSMYIDPMSMYREYVQNSADAIDLARSAGVLHDSGRVEIRVDPSSRTVFIRDNGCGLGREQFVYQLTALGGSKKRGTRARGFRGVGRLAGLAFCQELIFRSRQDGENTVHELRWDSREVRSLLRSSDNSSDLRDIVARTVQTREVPGRNWPQRFFEVELRGVARHLDDRLLNEDAVANYLSQIAPVPFSPKFEFGDQIRSFLESHGASIGGINLELVGHGPVYRPHGNSLMMGKSGETHFHELATIYTPGRDGEVAAATWILHHDYRGSLPASSLVEGWRFRAGDIQVGDNNLVQALFPEARFNAWCVAETHVLDPHILPNGRRDHFEQNTYYFDLINHLAPHARDIAQRCRTSSITRNLLRSIDSDLNVCVQNMRILQKGAMNEAASSRLAAKINATLDQLHRMSSRSVVSADQRLRYQSQIKRFRRRLLRLSTSRPNAGILGNLTPVQRTVLGEVFNVIYQWNEDVSKVQGLVDKIVGRFKRKERSTKRNARRKTS